MDLEIDPQSPVPLYHQIAEALRVSIEAGTLAPGDALQPMREAAERWGVAIHTVRHAYAALAREGLVKPAEGARHTGDGFRGKGPDACRGHRDLSQKGCERKPPLASGSGPASWLRP